jgi:hypothetical protein
VPESIASLISGIVFAWLISRRRAKIQQSLALIELAFEILEDQPRVFVVSFGLLATYVVYVIMWLIFFGQLMLIGHLETDKQADGHGTSPLYIN